MKTRSAFTKALTAIALAIAIGVSIAAWQTRQVRAVQGSEDKPSPFGFIELSAGQTARINLVSLALSRPPDPDTPPSNLLRRVRLAFDVYVQDDENSPNCGGTVPQPTCLIRYRFLHRESRDVELMPGQAASFNYLASAVTKINASVHFLGGPDTLPGNRRTPEPHLAPTLEVREGARTLFVVPAVAKFFNPQPDPPGHQ